VSTPVGPDVNAGGTTGSSVTCPANATNHGAAVSSVAHQPTSGGVTHGSVVSAMARSDCGKPAGAGNGAPSGSPPSGSPPTGSPPTGSPPTGSGTTGGPNSNTPSGTGNQSVPPPGNGHGNGHGPTNHSAVQGRGSH
jgi:hypothetical protein